jgi:hypothetical protein
MSSNHTRSHKRIARTAVVATTTGFAALALAGPASAAPYTTVINQDIGADCREDYCPPQVVNFTTTRDNVRIAFASKGGNCAVAVAFIEIDGQSHPSRFVAPSGGQPPFEMGLAPGFHTIATTFGALHDCTAEPAGFRGHLQIDEFTIRPLGKPPPAQAPNPGQAGRPNDRDSDGLFDADETNVYGTNPDVADTDGDGSDDGQEVFDGTNPLDPNDP